MERVCKNSPRFAAFIAVRSALPEVHIAEMLTEIAERQQVACLQPTRPPVLPDHACTSSIAICLPILPRVHSRCQVQRIPRYSLLLRVRAPLSKICVEVACKRELQDLIRHTPSTHSDYANLCSALEKVDQVRHSVLSSPLFSLHLSSSPALQVATYLNKKKSEAEHRMQLLEISKKLIGTPEEMAVCALLLFLLLLL